MRFLIAFLIIASTIQSLNCQQSDKWQSSGVTTIQGTIENFEKRNPGNNSIEVQIDDWTNAFRRKYFSKIDESGRFILTFFVFNTQEAYFNFNKEWLRIVVSPNDTLSLFINDKTFPDNVKFKGNTSKSCLNINDYFSNGDTLFKLSDSKINSILRDSLSFDNYKSWRDNVFLVENKKVENFLQTKPFDPFFNNWLRNLSEYKYHSDLIRYDPEGKRLSSMEKLNCLVSAINTLDPDSSKNVPTSSTSYFSLINPLSNTIFRLAKYYQIENYIKNFKPRSKTDVETNPIVTKTSKPPENLTKELFPFYIEATGTIKNRQIRESVLAHYYTSTLEMGRIDLGLDSVLLNISDEQIKASLINESNSYKWRTTYQNSLKFDNSADTLLNYLKNKYKGYVLYIDFWGTWCGPCYSGFQNAPEIKKAFENKKVAFVYLCCKCDEKKWSQDIKDYRIDGENILLTPDQFAHLSNMFNIIGVPKYVIIDKNGRIVNDNAPRPGPVSLLQQNVIKELTKYLIN
jgi:thiol-disulfide isomerase/thioredoxin